MSTFAVDASVAIKWFVPEIHHEFAKRLPTGRHQLHVPEFFYVEFGSILWKKSRRGELSQQETTAMMSDLVEMALIRHDDRDLAAEALHIALDSGRTVYDAVYVALAVRLGCKVATADERLRNALLGTKWERYILWVEDIP